MRAFLLAAAVMATASAGAARAEDLGFTCGQYSRMAYGIAIDRYAYHISLDAELQRVSRNDHPDFVKENEWDLVTFVYNHELSPQQYESIALQRCALQLPFN